MYVCLQLSLEARTRLYNFRREHSISSENHYHLLKQLHWTADDFEVVVTDRQFQYLYFVCMYVCMYVCMCMCELHVLFSMCAPTSVHYVIYVCMHYIVRLHATDVYMYVCMYVWLHCFLLLKFKMLSYFQFGLRQENTNSYSDLTGKSPYATVEKVSTLVSMYEFFQSLQAKKPKKIA
jgi:hypothetical protein